MSSLANTADAEGNRFQAVKTSLGKTYPRIIKLYENNLPEKLSSLDRIIQGEIVGEDKRRWAHSFKSMSRTVGAAVLGDLLAQLEAQAAADTPWNEADIAQVRQLSADSLAITQELAAESAG